MNPLPAVLLVAAISAGCARAQSAEADSANTPGSADSTLATRRRAGPEQEYQVKTQSIRRVARWDTFRALTASVVAISRRGHAAPVPSAIVPDHNARLWILQNSPGQIFQAISTVNALRTQAEPLPLSSRLVWPSALRRHKDRLYVSDDRGIHVYTSSGIQKQRIPSFLTIRDFAVGHNGRLHINPLSVEQPRPVVITIDQNGRHLGSWDWPRTDDSAAASEGLQNAAHLAACGPQLAVAGVHSPSIHLLDDHLRLTATIPVPFPGEDALRVLATQRTLVRPDPSTHWLPRFIAGISCSQSRLFVLLDLPWLQVVEIALDRNPPVSTTFADRSVDARRFMGLSGNSRLKLYTLRLNSALNPAVLQIRLH
jgi:hypothetical protein